MSGADSYGNSLCLQMKACKLREGITGEQKVTGHLVSLVVGRMWMVRRPH